MVEPLRYQRKGPPKPGQSSTEVGPGEGESGPASEPGPVSEPGLAEHESGLCVRACARAWTLYNKGLCPSYSRRALLSPLLGAVKRRGAVASSAQRRCQRRSGVVDVPGRGRLPRRAAEPVPGLASSQAYRRRSRRDLSLLARQSWGTRAGVAALRPGASRSCGRPARPMCPWQHQA
jgi:hypothetical protein